MMRRAGNASPEAIRAERTRSRASDTALSASPTTWNAGNPGATWTCTSTARASIPKGNRRNALDHAAPLPRPKVADAGAAQEYYGNIKTVFGAGFRQPAPGNRPLSSQRIICIGCGMK
jgi:hypothetical protein